MAVLIDTSVLGRLANTSDAAHACAASAVIQLHRRGESLRTSPQNLIEFRNFATRPVEQNGLGIDVARVEEMSGAFEESFAILPENEAIFSAWKSVIHTARVVGKQVHDARIVAICHTYQIVRLLTFNIAHFRRFEALEPKLVVLDPRSL